MGRLSVVSICVSYGNHPIQNSTPVEPDFELHE